MLFIHSWMCGLSLECGQPTKDHTLRENWGSLSQQVLVTNSSLASRGGASCPPSPHHAGILCDLSLHNFCAWCLNYCEFSCTTVLLCTENTVYLQSSTSASNNLSTTPSSTKISEPWEEEVWYWLSPLRAENPKYSCSLHFGQLWVSMSIIVYWRQKFLWCRLRDILIYQYNNKSLEASITLCLFSKVMAGGSLLDTMTSLATGFQRTLMSKCFCSRIYSPLGIRPRVA